MNIKHFVQTAFLLGVIALATGSFARADSYSFVSLSTAKINFLGNSTFSFSSVGGSNFALTSGPANGDAGDITGLFTIGNVTKIGGLSFAPVTGTGAITINDGVTLFSASVTWSDIYQLGTSSVLNDTATVNLTNITYTGTNPGLSDLAHGVDPSVSLNFTFLPAKTLAQLKTSSLSASFSGMFSYLEPVPDQGSEFLLIALGCAAIGLLALGRRMRPTAR